MDTLDNLINELESEVHTAKKATFSSDILLDKAKLLELVSRMRNSLPYIITEARQIKENEEKVPLSCSPTCLATTASRCPASRSTPPAPHCSRNSSAAPRWATPSTSSPPAPPNSSAISSTPAKTTSTTSTACASSSVHPVYSPTGRCMKCSTRR